MSQDPESALRIVKLAMVAAQLVIVGVVFVVPLPGGDDGTIALVLSAMAVINAAFSAVGWRVVLPQGPGSERPNFFIRLALAESVTLFGLVAAFLVGRATVVLPFGLVGLFLMLLVSVPASGSSGPGAPDFRDN